MFPAKFDYYRANSVEEAVWLLGQNRDAKLLAGGHSLIPMMKLRLAQPSALIDIGRLAELKGIQVQDGGLRIGALTTHAELEHSSVLAEHCPLLTETAGKIADPAVRNKGTIGGSIAHADPASDLPAALLALAAEIILVGPEGERKIAAQDFFVDLLTTAAAADEVLTAITVPAAEGAVGSCYLKCEQPASGFALCGAAAVVALDARGNCADAHLAFNGVTAVPQLARGVHAALAGSSLSDPDIERAVSAHLEFADPLSDLHASGEYRTALARVYGQRALRLARDRARA